MRFTETSNDYISIGVDAGCDFRIPATNKIILDGSSGGTYITEFQDGQMKFYCDSVNLLTLSEATPDTVSIYADILLTATKKIRLDGSVAGNTYIYESAADILDFYAGGVNLLKLTEAGGGASDKVSIPALTPLYFDGGTHTSIHESSDDVLKIDVGGDTMIALSEKGDDGNEVSFGSSCVGFTQLEPTYDATDTVVDFRHSNKQFVTFGSGNITNLASYFPLVSGNFVLLLKQDGTGSRTVTNWKVFEFDESSADGSAAVVWAGGSAPTLTTDANHVDILSFYWDADNEIAYGVATLDFQF